MKVNWSEPGLVVSGVAHAALLLAALVAFSDTKPFDDAQESVPVEVISASEFSQITKGEKTAKEAKPEPKPRADKVADVAELKPPAPELKRDVPTPPARPTEPDPVVPPTPPERPKEQADAEADAKARADAAARAAAAAAAAAAKAAAAKAQAQAQAEAKAQAEAEARDAEALRKAEEARQVAEAKAKADAKAKAEADARARADAEAKAKADAEARKLAQEKAAQDKARQEAEARKAEEIKKAEEKKAEDKKLAALMAEQPKPKPKPAPKAEDFDISDVDKLLTSKEKPSSAPSTAREINRTASLGAPNASGLKLSPSDRDAIGSLLKDQIARCWSVTPGMAASGKPLVRVSLNQDGSLSAEPVLLNPGRDPAFIAMAEGAVRAVKRCAPFQIPARYSPFFGDWKELKVTFDPAEMLG